MLYLNKSKMKPNRLKKEQRINIMFSHRHWFTKYLAYDDQTMWFCFHKWFLVNTWALISMWPINDTGKACWALDNKKVLSICLGIMQHSIIRWKKLRYTYHRMKIHYVHAACARNKRLSLRPSRSPYKCTRSGKGGQEWLSRVGRGGSGTTAEPSPRLPFPLSTRLLTPPRYTPELLYQDSH